MARNHCDCFPSDRQKKEAPMRNKYGYGLDRLAPNFNRGSDCFCVKCAQNCRQASGYGAATSPHEKAAPKVQAVSASGMPRGEDLD